MESKKHNPEKNNSHSGSSHEYPAEIEKIVWTLTLKAMAAGNEGDFNTAFLNIELALWLSRSLDKACLEAVLLNNLGLLYTLKGAWDRGLLFFDRSMEAALKSCPPDDRFLSTIKRNISCLFDPKIAPPGNPGDE